jgi:probable phosphomutase (TIGR03848 family)
MANTLGVVDRTLGAIGWADMVATPKPAARKSATKAKSPKPTLVIFVRHGKTPTTGDELPGRTPGLHLGDVGKQQAQTAADRIGSLGQRVAAIYASPLERTRETAAPIAATLGLKVQRNRGLLELDVGEWTGRKLRDLYKLPEWKTVQKYPSGFTFPGGESFSAMATRFSDTVNKLVAAHPGDTIVCVSHADPIRAQIAAAMGTHLDLFQRVVVSPCSISAVLYGADGPVVLTVNSIGGPLTELAPS